MPPAPPPPNRGRAGELLPTEIALLSETAVCDLISVGSGGHLHLAQPRPDDHGVDRLLYTTDSPAVLFLQVKAARTLERGGYLQFWFDANEIAGASFAYFGLCVDLTRAPELGDRFWLIPAEVLLHPRSKRGLFHVSVPLRPKRRTQWDSFVHPLADLVPVLAEALAGVARRFSPKAPNAERGSHLSKIAQGLVFEHAVTNELVAQSGGRIVCYEPPADVEGLDRLVKLVADSDTIGLQIKGTFKRNRAGLVRVHIRAKTFDESRLNFVVVLEYDEERRQLAPTCWVIRTDELAQRARKERGDFIFVASPDPRSRDQFSPWRYRVSELGSVIGAILAVLNREGRACVLPTARHEVRAAGGELLGVRPAARPRRPARGR